MLLGVDVGGTFTDAVLVTDTGALHTAKVASTPAEESHGVLEAIHAVLAHAGERPQRIERFAHGMTVATNALLEGRGARTVLIATEGFTDVVELGRQARPHLYRLEEMNPAPLVGAQSRFGAPERMTPAGPLRALEREAAIELVERVADTDPEAVAVVLLHSYAHPEHERLLGELLAERVPGVHRSLSHELVGTFREYERAASTEVDAALSPLLASYLSELERGAEQLGLGPVEVMQSSGGLTDARRAASHAALTVLSGPAGGVGGALLLAEQAGERDVLCFDMGGTSCDVCVIESSRVTETAERVIAGRPLSLPALDIHTVGAGGGSIAWRDAGGALRVGPSSAGARPGPACYGRGGTLPTVTDANLVLGRLLDDSPLAGGVTLDRRAAERAVDALASEVDLDRLTCAEGIVRVAEAEMGRALRVMTVERGIDPRGLALMPFGGAGPLHAAALAEQLGITRILCPRTSGVLSALGLAAAASRRDAARTVMLTLESSGEWQSDLKRILGGLIERVKAELGAENPDRVRVRYELRYRGQSFELPVEQEFSATPDLTLEQSLSLEGYFGAEHDESRADDGRDRSIDGGALRERFEAAHEERYGYRDAHGVVELVTVRVSAWGAAPTLRWGEDPVDPPVSAERSLVLDGHERLARCLSGALPAGMTIEGPALCALPDCTLLVRPEWAGDVDTQGTIRLTRTTQ